MYAVTVGSDIVNPMLFILVLLLPTWTELKNLDSVLQPNSLQHCLKVEALLVYPPAFDSTALLWA